MALFVGRLPTRNFDDRDLEDIFYKYGKIVKCQLKRGSRFAFGFVEFENPEDAYDAIRDTDGLDIDGTRIVVEKAKGTPRKQNDTTCYNCGEEGHWARDCKRSRRDHRGGDRYRSRSRTPDRYGSRQRDYRRGRSYSRSRSPYGRRGRSYSRTRSSRRDSPSPRRGSRSPRRSSPSPRRVSPSPRRSSRSPRRPSRSPRRDSRSPRRRSPSPGSGRSYRRSVSPSNRNQSNVEGSNDLQNEQYINQHQEAQPIEQNNSIEQTAQTNPIEQSTEAAPSQLEVNTEQNE